MAYDELRALFIFEGLDDDALAELAEVGTVVTFADGDELFHEAEPADFWWVLLEGSVALLRGEGPDETQIAAMDVPGRWAGGFRAWSEVVGYLATGRAHGPGRVFRVPAPALAEFVRTRFPFGMHLIEGFFQTVRNVDALARQREAMVALGTLAAGLAHELNNPASAAMRAVDSLETTQGAFLASSATLATGGLSGEQFLALDAMRREIDPSTVATEPIAVADREDRVVEWLDEHDVEESWRIAPALAQEGIDVEWCERAAGLLGDAMVGPGLDWVAATISMTTLVAELEEAMGRVTELVSTVRSYTQLDRAQVREVDVTEGIEATLGILGAKLDGVNVERDYADDVPRIEAMPGELNQVWTNLVDNAIDAMGGQGTLRLSTRTDGDDILVEVADTGAGMPEDVAARAFEPFFTTKDVGDGTGLGLDISRRIVVDRHRGDIAIDSEPGRTVITVRLPITMRT